MKFVQFIRFAVLGVAMIFSASVASAQTGVQSPNNQVGVGVTVGNGFYGGNVAYALNPAFHLGTQFGFTAGSQSAGTTSVSQTNFLFAPYGKFIFAAGPLKPIVTAQFYVDSNSGGTGNGASTSNTGFIIAAGGQYFANKNFGLSAQFRFLDLQFGDNSHTAIGLGATSICAEWFFNQ